ncbi:MAG: DNA mismatch repair endonuclease MutL [Clostridia bacterium]|nr:DNA mismatch repair endonuclease MutL [Clostridia bacterium]
MGRINVLGFDVANLIAAGEVVDRPASVVKELLENAVDSGATEITLEIKNGGISHIRVSDNGCGMDADDLPVAILRHATSKIKDADDLDRISTLGFRGEALAAIAAVTKLRIYSRPEDSDEGALLICDGGEIVELCEAGCAKGTTVIADELFYNVPARRKFLKRDATECAKITEIAERLALSVPDISVKYICDGEIRFMTQGDGDLSNAIYSVLGKRIASGLVKVSRQENGVTVSGYVSSPDITFSKRSEEIFFLNGRYIKSPLLMAALERAYVSNIPDDKFPMCVLNIAVSTNAVDVNVHPTKLEVKFSNDRIVSEALYYAVLTALKSSQIRPELKTGPVYGQESAISARQAAAEKVINAFAPVEKPKDDRDVQLEITSAKKVKTPLSDHHAERSSVGVSSILAGYDIPERIKEAAKQETQKTAPEVPSERSPKISLVSDTEDTTEKIPEYRILGEAYDCYVIVELSDRLLMIDKHAAHERIIFEELRERRKNKVKENQALLAPITVSLTRDDALSLEEYASDIRQIGFEFELSPDGYDARISSYPVEIPPDAIESAFCAMLHRLSDGKESAEVAEAEYFEKALYQASCKAAIKGGKNYGIDHIKWICDKILKEPGDDGSVIKTCPHGRPVAFEIKRSSIERQFLRLE